MELRIDAQPAPPEKRHGVLTVIANYRNWKRQVLAAREQAIDELLASNTAGEFNQTDNDTGSPTASVTA